jgi:hypothetical protein
MHSKDAVYYRRQVGTTTSEHSGDRVLFEIWIPQWQQCFFSEVLTGILN